MRSIIVTVQVRLVKLALGFLRTSFICAFVMGMISYSVEGNIDNSVAHYCGLTYSPTALFHTPSAS
jgi:hypothetical protein